MIIPRIVHQTSTRWCVVTKPRGWSLGQSSTAAESNIESFLTPIIGTGEKLYFPIEVDSRMSAIAIVCTDRGMQAQFERFKDKQDLRFSYSVLLQSDVRSIKEHGVNVSCHRDPMSGRMQGCIDADYLFTFTRLNDTLQGRILGNNVHLHTLSFPDPLNPKMHELTISIPTPPEEGWDI